MKFSTVLIASVAVVSAAPIAQAEGDPILLTLVGTLVTGVVGGVVHGIEYLFGVNWHPYPGWGKGGNGWHKRPIWVDACHCWDAGHGVKITGAEAEALSDAIALKNDSAAGAIVAKAAEKAEKEALSKAVAEGVKKSQ
ncbi:hypothetical protein DICA3_D22650 [Diutina catenulata]